jgi:hypothetical protein
MSPSAAPIAPPKRCGRHGGILGWRRRGLICRGRSERSISEAGL